MLETKIENTVNYYAATEIGYKRGHNEDSFSAKPEHRIWLIADGMGGHAAGEVASEIVTDQVVRAYIGGASIEESLKIANQAVIDAPKRGYGIKGMGSTVVALTLTGNAYEIVWVGDSRAYLWSGESLTQLTHDHTYVQGLIDSDVITEENAANHPFRNVLDQAIGLEADQLSVGRCTGEIQCGERILLCSDGLSGEVSGNEIEEVFKKSLDDRATVESLIDTALSHGGVDNITVIVVSV